MKVEAIDLFCGVGGLTHGVELSGIDVKVGYDFEESCRYPYEANNNAKFILKDIKSLNEFELSEQFSSDVDIKILMGCAPCQPFSSYSHRYQENEVQKNKMDLLDYFGDQVRYVKPHIVSMENVPQMINKNVFKDFVKLLETSGYKVSFQTVYAPDYGVPQSRKRLILLASNIGQIKLLGATHDKGSYPTLRETISHLPSIKAGEISSIDSLHQSSQLNELNLKRIKNSKPGGTWRDWPVDLLPNCYLKKSGQSYGSVYGRLEWDGLCSTITTQFNGYGNGRFGHPTQQRALSLREGALLQTFPEYYQFSDNERKINVTKTAMLIGNAVPVKLGEAIGKSIIQHIREVKKNG